MRYGTLGKSGIKVSALGMGCWAIGGIASQGGKPGGWGAVNDNESIKALHCAIDLGVNLFDSADGYGNGHSEEVLGKAMSGRRDNVLLATKFGSLVTRNTPAGEPVIVTEAKLRESCEASLKRLKTDYIDLYQLHIGDYELERVPALLELLEKLVHEGKIRYYGWSTDDRERAAAFAEGAHCVAVQFRLNLVEGERDLAADCESLQLSGLNRSPLAMGLLTGKFTAASTMDKDDIRSRWWDFSTPDMQKRLKAVEMLKEVLCEDGRTPSQGALGWLWAVSDRMIPIPGFKTVAQVTENAGAAGFGPLTAAQMARIDDLLKDIEW